MQRGRGGGDFGGNTQGGGIPIVSRPADFARTVKDVAIRQRNYFRDALRTNFVVPLARSFRYSPDVRLRVGALAITYRLVCANRNLLSLKGVYG